MSAKGVEGVSESRWLLMMRHAKSAWPPGVPDYDRPLAERGIRDAPVAARRVLDLIGPPDLVLVSPARRTRDTYELVSAAWNAAGVSSVEHRLEPLIYEATRAVLQEVVAELPEAAHRVILIGHNPGLQEFALTWPLTAETQAHSHLAEKFPTCGLALTSVRGSWAQGRGRLESVQVPRADPRPN